MSKQEKLISADKLLKCLKKELGFCIKEKFNEKNSRFHLGRETVLTDIIRQIESGTFNPDPVPTIKPGDKVRYLARDFGIGVVMGVYGGETVNVQFSDLYKSCKVSDLEVVKDE